MSKIGIAVILVFSFKTHAIVGGVTSSGPRPSYLSETDRVTMQSHTVVVLNSQNSSQHSRCSGTLIAPNVVLTAAHCVPESLENFWVVTSPFEFALLERHQVSQVIVHEDYKKFDLPSVNKPNHDLALLKFEGHLPAGYTPTQWVSTFSPQADRFWLYVAGYGIIDEVLYDSGELRFSRVTIENSLLNSNQSFLKGNQINGEGICHGDSGGPAYIKIQNEFYVMGVVSAVVGCKGVSYFNQSVFYADWIRHHLDQIVK